MLGVVEGEGELALRERLGEVDDGIVQGAVAAGALAAGAVVVDGLGVGGYGAEVWVAVSGIWWARLE